MSRVASGLQEYRSHKYVRAAAIADVRRVGGELVVDLVGVDTPVTVSESFLERRQEVQKRYPGDKGVYVLYADGYESVSPTSAFEEGNQLMSEVGPVSGFDFGVALFHLGAGRRVRRAGWNGKGMWLAQMPGLQLPPFSAQEPGAKVNDRTAKFIGEDVVCIAHIPKELGEMPCQ